MIFHEIEQRGDFHVTWASRMMNIAIQFKFLERPNYVHFLCMGSYMDDFNQFIDNNTFANYQMLSWVGVR